MTGDLTDDRQWPNRHITTHDPRGGGRPRLIFTPQGRPQTSNPREFELTAGITTIGCSSTADLQLDGIDELHAEIRRNEADEYHFFHLGSADGSTIDGRSTLAAVLQTGSRISLGQWTMLYFREEFADHGRPHGGRQGGELAVQRPQVEPQGRGTSPDGGRDQTAEDPGEYY